MAPRTKETHRKCPRCGGAYYALEGTGWVTCNNCGKAYIRTRRRSKLAIRVDAALARLHKED